MRELKILNAREIKRLSGIAERQWGVKLDKKYAYLKSPRNKLYIVSREISRLDLDALNINNMGIYFGTLRSGERLRLSVEGSQIIGPDATKNTLDVDIRQARLWILGKEIPVEREEKEYVLVKFGDQFLGCGKIANGKLLNYVPKSRRIELAV
jgi:NOL1/NOP2/fmu family ribosome biogenesis protein